MSPLPSEPLNRDPAALPAQCDVLVVGAGPAGSAAAITLARAGFDVVLVDQHPFPRDKVCGDGLIPDAHNALRKLGVLDEVMALAQPCSHVGCIGPRGGRVDVPGTLAVLPRRELDLVLCRAAAAAGARMFAPVRFAATVEEEGRVVGAQLKCLGRASSGETTHELRAAWVVLATGAVPQALLACGMSKRHTPSGVALRGYVRNERMVGRIDKLEIVWHRALSPGYGWIFPCRDGVFNIGVGIADSHDERQGERLTKKEVNLRQVFDDFTRVYAPARELIEGGAWTSPLKGAPLRCTLEGATYSRPGLIVTGEAAGSTYSFSGEGIGKALETGILAAEAMVEGRSQSHSDEAVRARYEAGLLALKPRFDLYARANKVNRHPWLADLLIWRAKKSERLLRRMSGVLNETSNPGHLVSVKGMLRLFTE
ncbi:geranylgeranyl reductase family protein [Piscinibacter sp. XHJ-5]|uniref:NAD(P)/FAD-dependent oxidoreductase n=1 Tax=Piscinibacter sp. XHJ-5 TaxID=3037797 RepID=UPI002452C1CC|nr:geranylgeranyl reductase family protein [Piscinibacter sp. XHJ-5]